MMAGVTTTSIKQNRANVEAVLTHHGLLPDLTLVATFKTRCLYRPTVKFWVNLGKLLTTGKFIHWQFYGEHGITAVNSWREAVPRCSLQLVQHGNRSGETTLVEADVDWANPGFGAYHAFRHLFRGTWFEPDPFKVRAGLLRRGVQVPNEGA